MTKARSILVAEADPACADLIRRTLQLEGHELNVVGSAGDLFDALATDAPDLLLLSGELPDLVGSEVLRRLDAMADLGTIPKIVISASTDEIDRVVAFELGTDDYVARPFSTRELALRVRAILRRHTKGVRPARQKPRDRVEIGPLTIDLPRHRAQVFGEPVELTPLEFKLLAHLATRAGRVETREALLETVWEQPRESVTRAVDTSVKRLRKKLGDAGAWIETVRGVGYRLRDDSGEAAAC